MDILFVIDNSGSMEQEQTNLIANFPNFISVLDASGLDYRVAVTTTSRNYSYNMSTPLGNIPESQSGGDNGTMLKPSSCNMTKRWMPRATYDHTPHRMMTCSSCHQAEASTKTSDVLLPKQAVCATCHAPAKNTLRPASGQAENRCFECHQHHEWKKSQPITPPYSLTDFK